MKPAQEADATSEAAGFAATRFVRAAGFLAGGLRAAVLGRWGRVRWLNTKAHSASLRLAGLLP